MSSVVISGDSSGTVSLTVPSVAGTNTATLPAATGTVMVSGNMPAFAVYSNANQSVSSGVATKVALNTEDVDTNNCFDSTTNYRFTPTVAGYYQLNLPLVGYSSSTQISSVAVMLYKNGSQYTYSQNNTSATAIASASLSIVVYANGTTDYFEMYGAVGGTNVFISGGSSRTTTFSGSLVRAA